MSINYEVMLFYGIEIQIEDWEILESQLCGTGYGLCISDSVTGGPEFIFDKTTYMGLSEPAGGNLLLDLADLPKIYKNGLEAILERFGVKSVGSAGWKLVSGWN